MEQILEQFPIVIQSLNVGFLQTLKLFAVTLLGAIPLGLIISFGSMSRFRPLRYFTRIIVWIIRGTPLMIQLLIIYFFPGWCWTIQSGEAEKRGALWRLLLPSFLTMPVIFLRSTGAGSRVCLTGRRRPDWCLA